MGDLGLRNSY